MRRLSCGQWRQLRCAFKRVCRYFGLSKAEQAFAWERARARDDNPAGALRCYTAIARSLR
jgi:hypothetical protein